MLWAGPLGGRIYEGHMRQPLAPETRDANYSWPPLLRFWNGVEIVHKKILCFQTNIHDMLVWTFFRNFYVAIYIYIGFAATRMFWMAPSLTKSLPVSGSRSSWVFMYQLLSRIGCLNLWNRSYHVLSPFRVSQTGCFVLQLRVTWFISIWRVGRTGCCIAQSCVVWKDFCPLEPHKL